MYRASPQRSRFNPSPEEKEHPPVTRVRINFQLLSVYLGYKANFGRKEWSVYGAGLVLAAVAGLLGQQGILSMPVEMSMLLGNRMGQSIFSSNGTMVSR